jgi:hypothetical protein
MGTSLVANAIVPVTVANRATIVLSALNSKACFFSGAGAQAVATGSPASFSQAQPFTIQTIANRQTNIALGRSVSDQGGNINLGYSATANTARISSAVSTVTATDGAFHSVAGVYNGASSIAIADGVAGTAGSTATAFTNTQFVMMTDTQAGPGGSGMTGYMCEAMLISGALNSTQYGALSTNARLSNRWGNSFWWNYLGSLSRYY